MIRLKRAYENASPEDGYRVLVERYWPRDLDEKRAKIDLWLKEISPSEELHAEFGDSPTADTWHEFQRRYWRELLNKHKSIKILRRKMQEGPLTLIHTAHNPEHSSAAVLKRFLETAEQPVAPSIEE